MKESFGKEKQAVSLNPSRTEEKRQTVKELKEDVREKVARRERDLEGDQGNVEKPESAGVTSWTFCAPELDEQNNDWLYILLQVSTVYIETCERSVYVT